MSERSGPGRADRDRDETGRPRNARPRDASGRPLPRGAAGEGPGPEEPALPPAEARGRAPALLDEGRPFHAHEVLEASWKAAPAQERDLGQGLAQVAVGLTHAQRGNARGAVTLLRRGADRISPPGRAQETPAPHGIDAAGVAAAARALAGQLERDGLSAGSGLTVRLRGPQPGRPPA